METTNNIEKKINETIKKYKLFTKKDKIAVACSGGKDSTVALYIIKKLGYNVEAITIDLEIGNYSKENLKNIKEFCTKHKIILHEFKFRDRFGYSKCTIERMLRSKGITLNSCTICGILRRHMLNRCARDLKFDVIVTGHNMDDEAQAILMNFFRNTLNLQSRLGPISGRTKNDMFVSRVKPLYFCLESDIKKYSQEHDFSVVYSKCPCVKDSFRNKIREILNNLHNPSLIKKNIVHNFILMLPRVRKIYEKNTIIERCDICGEPSANKVCTTCNLLNTLK
jgi:uncharacterized protein (TIGR00269 family)